MTSKQRYLLIALAAAASVQATGGLAQTTSRPLTLIVPYETGASTDVFARALARAYTERGNPLVIVENRPGASGVVGTAACARAKPDGNTICQLPRDMISIVPQQQQVPYDPVRDLEPVTNLFYLINVIVVSPKLPVTTFKELIDYSKKYPNKLNYTAFAVAQPVMQWILNQTGADMTFVPYKSGVIAMPAFMAGELHVMYLSLASPGLAGRIRSGELKAIAVPTRTSALPGVPSFVDLGLPKFNVQSWNGLFAPAGTPKDALARLASEFTAVVRSAEFRDKIMAPIGFEPIGTTPAEFAATLVDDRRDGAVLAKLAGARVQ
jgi:tripartite-type tricarboxylate transporter receptor subunit TctC